jgi:hypothetical protein
MTGHHVQLALRRLIGHGYLIGWSVVETSAADRTVPASER